MRLHFPATLDLKEYNRLGITKGDDLLILSYPEVYRDKIRAEMRKIVEKNAKNAASGKEPVELDVNIDIHYKKRSLDQNAWLWEAHTLEANIVNGHKSAWTDDQKIKWREAGSVTPEIIHEDYLERFAPRGIIDVQPGMVDAVRQMVNETMGRVVDEKWIPENQVMRFTVWKTSSYMNVAEFCQLSERVKEQMISYGINLDDAVDWNNLMIDLEGVKSRAVTQEEKAKESSLTVTQAEAPLTKQKDPVSMVAGVFKGEIQEDLF
jgi:hypothetical protein